MILFFCSILKPAIWTYDINDMCSLSSSMLFFGFTYWETISRLSGHQLAGNMSGLVSGTNSMMNILDLSYNQFTYIPESLTLNSINAMYV